MEQSDFIAIKRLLNSNLIRHCLFNNHLDIPFLNNIKLTMNIFNLEHETHYFFAKAHVLLEYITVQKAWISNYKKTLKGRNNYKIKFTTTLDLRKINALTFFYFFILLITFNMLKKKQFLKISYYKEGNFLVFLKDINVIPGIIEHYFKWEYALNVNFFLNRSNTVFTNLYLHNFGFPFIF